MSPPSSCLLVVALGVGAAAACSLASPWDTTALLQTESRVHSGPAEQKDDSKRRGSKGTGRSMAFRPGEKAEAIVLEGESAGKWLACTVLWQDKRSDTYTISLDGLEKNISNIPFGVLRRLPPELDLNKDISDGVLLFWAVGSQDYTIDLVTQNIDHLRKTYDGRADVFLGHYDGQQDVWLSHGEDWYKKNVQFSSFKNWKLKRHKPAGFPPQLIFAHEFLQGIIEKRQYRWVWLLDEAVDFRNTNMNLLFADALATNSLIAAPTITLANHTAGGIKKIAYSACDPQYKACAVHTVKPECSYRYVNFIDMMFPLIHPRALMEMYASCSNCMQQIDHVWCRRSARLLRKPADQACAILDSVSVGFSNSVSLKKLSAKVNLNEGDARSSEKDDWVDTNKIQTLTCVGGVD